MKLDDALALVRKHAWMLPLETVELGEALNRFLAEEVTSDQDLPPFDRSMLDGFACRRGDLPGPMPQADYVIAGDLPAGELPSGACARVMTGAPVPAEADYVFGIEHAETLPEGIRFTGQAGQHGNIARRGEDVRTGDRLLRQGARLLPQHIAVLATAGRSQVEVARRPRVGILGTGTELVPVNQIPSGAQIRNSNTPQLMALCQMAGAEATDLGIVADEREIQREVLREALDRFDVVISTGGVSVGDRDYVPELLTELCVDIQLRKVDIQPGKPIVFGVRGETAVFGLAGNPLSSYVQFLLLVEPFLYALQGGKQERSCIKARLAEPLTRGNAARALYRPVSINATGSVRPVAYHGSGHLTSYVEADALAIMPMDVSAMEAGEAVELILLR